MPCLNSRSLKLASSVAAAALMLTSPAARADFVIADDLIVQGSICSGFDCVNGESFGFDTIRLKENNARMQFNDTSVGSFPTGNWQIRANDSFSGGANFLGIVDQGATGDSETGTIVFSVAAGAGANSIFVNSSGNVGFGTGSPVVRLHATNGNTPTLRLEQNGTSGFTPQTWDLAGNEANFFIRDATNGSTLPLRIRPGAPSSAIDVEASGSVGISTSSPTGKLHVFNSHASEDGIRVTNTGTNANLMRLEATNATATGVGFVMDPSGGANFWQFTATANENIFRINRSGGNGTEFELNQNGNLTITGSLFSGGGTCGGGCDAVFDADYTVPSIEQHAALMWADGYLPAVGPTPENAPINVSDKLGRVLNELEHAHIYIAELNAQQKQQTAYFTAEIEALKAQLAAR